MGELKAWDSATNSNVPLDKTGEDGLAPKQYRLPTNFAFGATETHRESRRQIMLIAMKLPFGILPLSDPASTAALQLRSLSAPPPCIRLGE